MLFFIMHRRFGSEFLSDHTEAPLQPLAIGSENRVFKSKGLSYQVWEGARGKESTDVKLRQAALLISPEGEKLIKDHPGTLSGVDDFLVRQTQVPFERGFGRFVVNKPNLFTDSRGKQYEVFFLGGGSQSRVFRLKTDGMDLVVKRHADLDSLQERESPIQAYSSEMIQTQNIRKDLRNILERLNMDFGEFLFASGQVACMWFIEGKKPEENEENAKRILELNEAVEEYVANQLSKKVDVWRYVRSDLAVDQKDPERPPSPRWVNFIQAPNGKLVCIDPFFRGN